MPSPLRVLLVEDDVDLQVTTRLVLEQHGFAVQVVGDGIRALEVIRAESFEVALIDVMLPGMDGIRLTRRARELSALPIVMLTARDLPHDEIQGLEAGADDYVVKPFDGDILAARLHAVVRRVQSRATIGDAGILERGSLRIDGPGMTLERDGQPISLSTTEFRIIYALGTHPGVVMSRSDLLDMVWSDTEWTDPRVVDVNIQRIRSKIGAEHIETIRGVGYKMPR